jgi:hypothetical protein
MFNPIRGRGLGTVVIIWLASLLPSAAHKLIPLWIKYLVCGLLQLI